MGGSVLIIDGDQQFAESAQSALEAAGITAHVRPDASLDVVRALRPHVLMLNVELPRGSGFSICSRIRRDKALQKTPILLTSSDTPVEALQRHAQTPDRANDYAKKPLQPGDVVVRIERLLAIAPERPEPEPEPEGPPPLAPPPIPSGAAAPAGGPPPMPPKLRRTDGGGSSPPQAALPEEELWPRAQYDDAIRGAVSPMSQEIRLTGRATPEERIEQLRQQVKQLEQQKRSVQDAWGGIDLRGQELARRVVSLGLEGQAKDGQIQELIGERDRAAQQLEDVRNEFRAFQEEITRIFQEKDAEEQGRLAHYGQLEQSNLALSAQLQEAQERQLDDERRLQIMQEELDYLQTEKDGLEERLAETQTALDEKTRSEADLEARLGTTETVAAERADEVSNLRDQLDDLAINTTEARQAMEAAHAQALADLTERHTQTLAHERAERAEEHGMLVETHSAQLAEQAALHASTVASLRDEAESAYRNLKQVSEDRIHALEVELAETTERMDEQRIQELAEVNQRHADLLDALSGTHEAELAELTEARDDALNRAADLEEVLQGTRVELDAKRVELADTTARLTAERDAARGEAARLSAQVANLSQHEAELEQERSELEQELEETGDALRETRGRIAELEVELAEVRDAGAADSVRLQGLLQAEQTSAAERVASLEDELDQARNDLFERSSTLDALQAAHERLVEAHQELGQQLETTALALEASEATVSEAEVRAAAAEDEQDKLAEQVERLEAQHSRLEAVVRETRQMLESERATIRDLEDELTKVRAALAAAQESVVELEDEVETERLAREALEQAKEIQERARMELEGALDDLEASRDESEAARQAELQAREQLAQHLANTQAHLQAREAALADAEAARLETVRQAEAVRREKNAEISKAERALKTREADMARLEGELAARAQEASVLMDQLAEAQALAADAQAQTRDSDQALAEAHRQLHVMKAQLDASSAAAGDAQTAAANLARARDDALGAAEQARAAAHAAAEDLRTELVAVSSERDQLRVAARTAEARVRKLEGDLKSSRTEVEARGASGSEQARLLATKEQEIAQWQAHAGELRASLEAMQQHLAKVEAERDYAKMRPGKEADADVRKKLAAAQAEVRALHANEHSMRARIDDLEERVNEARFTQESVKGTLQAMERDLAKESRNQKGFTAQYSLLLGKVSRAIAQTRELLEGVEDSHDIPELGAGAVELLEFTGEVEPLEMSSATTHSGPFAPGPRTGGSAEAAGEPFADLVRELRAAAEEDEGPPTFTGPRKGFDESFASEPTTADHAALARRGAGRRGEDEPEEDERDVTEIINLSDLE
ncbi:MAG: response regulator [Deltaproteobacteria bacterium]|nr:response regulator [Deltaproteobacteria bacterium]